MKKIWFEEDATVYQENVRERLGWLAHDLEQGVLTHPSLREDDEILEGAHLSKIWRKNSIKW